MSSVAGLQDLTSTAFGDEIIVDYLASSFSAMRDMGPAVYRPFMQAMNPCSACFAGMKAWPSATCACALP